MWLHKVIPQVYEMLALRIESDNPVGVSTGINELDDKLGGGWLRQQTSYLVGESGVGKSWLTSWWILTAAGWLSEGNRPLSGYIISGNPTEQKEIVQDKDGKKPIVVYWSLEMSESLICYRLLTQSAYKMFGQSIDSKRLLSGNLHDDQLEILRETWKGIERHFNNLYLEFNIKTLGEFDELLMRLSSEYDVCYVVVDYFRLIDVIGADGIADAQSLRSSGLKRLAKDYDCHVQAIFDITREGEKAERIEASHMKGGTAARYDSDLTMSIASEEDDGNVTHLLLNTLKTRLVPAFSIPLRLDKATGVVESLKERRDVMNV